MIYQRNDSAGESVNTSTPGQTANVMEVERNAKQPGAATLRTVADTVRRIVRADTASVVSFSLENRTIMWRATSGFRAHVTPSDEIVRPLRNVFERCATGTELITIEGIGERVDLPAEDFPVLITEGVHYAALAPLCARHEVLGALVIGFRSAHKFTDEEKQTLAALADMAALALDNARLFETVGSAKRIWEQTFDAVASGIIVHDQNMQIVRCNAHAAEMMGLQLSEAIGLSCADAFARLFGERAAAYHMGQGTGAASAFELQAEDGRRYLVSVAPLDVGDIQGSVVTWSDVTELSEMQEQLSRSRRLATVGQLAAGVAHEINNPLAAITTCAEATLRDIKRDAEATAMAESRDWSYYLEEIVRQALSCKEITRGLLDLSRQRRPNRLPCDINDMAAQCARLAEDHLQASAVKVNVSLDEEV